VIAIAAIQINVFANGLSCTVFYILILIPGGTTVIASLKFAMLYLLAMPGIGFVANLLCGYSVNLCVTNFAMLYSLSYA
jgi:hypothetical protein